MARMFGVLPNELEARMTESDLAELLAFVDLEKDVHEDDRRRAERSHRG